MNYTYIYLHKDEKNNSKTTLTQKAWKENGNWILFSSLVYWLILINKINEWITKTCDHLTHDNFSLYGTIHQEHSSFQFHSEKHLFKATSVISLLEMLFSKTNLIHWPVGSMEEKWMEFFLFDEKFAYFITSYL